MIGTLMYAALLFFTMTAVPASEQLTILPEEDRAAWRAVGLVASKGPDGTVMCSGTLVTPDLVVTAAHCVAHKTRLMDSIQSFAGLNRTRRASTSSAIEVLRYPVWDHATGKKQGAHRLGRIAYWPLNSQRESKCSEVVSKGRRLARKRHFAGIWKHVKQKPAWTFRRYTGKDQNNRRFRFRLCGHQW